MTGLHRFRWIITRAGAVLSLAIAPQAFAQDTITVEGERIETADVRSTARDVTVGSRATQTPLARYQRPVCPGVWGMTEENAQAVLDRIVFNAITAGVPVSEEPDCGANAWVIVVDEAPDTFEELLEEDSFLTRHMTRYQIRTVRGDDSNALGWNLITTRNPDTGIVQPDGFQLAGLMSLARILPRADPRYVEVPPNVVSMSSRLELGIRTDIELSVVLVERSALGGIDSHALADYATMRLLAPTEPPDEGSVVSTVLTLFSPEVSGGAAPQRMTAFDRSYLRALYRSSPTRPARIALGNIAGAMESIETP